MFQGLFSCLRSTLTTSFHTSLCFHLLLCNCLSKPQCPRYLGSKEDMSWALRDGGRTEVQTTLMQVGALQYRPLVMWVSCLYWSEGDSPGVGVRGLCELEETQRSLREQGAYNSTAVRGWRNPMSRPQKAFMFYIFIVHVFSISMHFMPASG